MAEPSPDTLERIATALATGLAVLLGDRGIKRLRRGRADADAEVISTDAIVTAIKDHLEREHDPLGDWKDSVDRRLNTGATTIHQHTTQLAVLERSQQDSRREAESASRKLDRLNEHVLRIMARLGVPSACDGD